MTAKARFLLYGLAALLVLCNCQKFGSKFGDTDCIVGVLWMECFCHFVPFNPLSEKREIYPTKLLPVISIHMCVCLCVKFAVSIDSFKGFSM